MQSPLLKSDHHHAKRNRRSTRAIGFSVTSAFGMSIKEHHQRQVSLNPEKEKTPDFPGNYVRTTRYTIINFFPKNLLEQMRRLANVYFLLISILQVSTNLSPTGKFTTIVPFSIILLVSAIKEAIEDYGRYRSDVETNNRQVDILNIEEQKWESKAWKDIKVGDFVRVKDRQYFPADIVILCSSQPDSIAYIETSNLDGETNLKIKQPIAEMETLLASGRNENAVITGEYDISRLKNLDGFITCEPPNNRLYDFSGSLTQNGFTHSLGYKQLLLRGSQLRQTSWIVGCVVFTGYDTKVVLNSSKAKSKRSNIEKRTNRFILVILSILLGLCLSVSITNAASTDDALARFWYLPDPIGSLSFISIFATYLILLGTLVPLSLYVTLEIVRLVQSFHINWDINLFDPVSQTPGLVRSSGLNEELGQVEYVFADKTGTLTDNVMEFRKLSVGGTSYGKGYTEISRILAQKEGKVIEETKDEKTNSSRLFNFHDPSFYENLVNPDHTDYERINQFVTLLAVCHAVVPEITSNGELFYQSSSPDEEALVTAAQHFGYCFRSRTLKAIEVVINGQSVWFDLLNTIAFTSERKLMSVIVRRSDSGKIFLYSKGAETAVFSRLSTESMFQSPTEEFLKVYAEEGLRTLCGGYRELDEQTWKEWNVRYQAAMSSLENRQRVVDEVSSEIEKDLILLGCTGIEDKLQVGVPDCISALRAAHIKIWVLTGDKQETAVNIAHACSLFDQNMRIIVINENNEKDTRARLKSLLSEVTDFHHNTGLVIDGKSLDFVLFHEDLRSALLRIGTVCSSVVCCRVSPRQKAEITLLVKKRNKSICLAIGDGANDVAMLQSAHIGVGISGKEGMQAVQASDYAIAQFRFLKRLILVHGHWNYRRIARVITYNFYKNMYFFLTQFWYSAFNFVSGQSLFEPWTQSGFNIYFTSLPILAYGILDQDMSDEELYKNPESYTIGQQKKLFGSTVFSAWLRNAIVHSVVTFLIPVFLFLSIVSPDARDRSLFPFGLYVYTPVVYVCSFKVLLMTRSFNRFSVLSVFISILNWFIWLLGYSFMIVEPSQLDSWMFAYKVIDLPSWWLSTLLIVVVVLIPDFVWRAMKDGEILTGKAKEVELVEISSTTKVLPPVA